MVTRNKLQRRRGACVVEAAIVLPVMFTVILSILVGGVWVFRYQEVAYIARETARYASVHGYTYTKNNAAAITSGTLPNVTDSYLTTYAQGKTFTLDPSQLQVSVTMTVITPGATAATTTESVDWDNTTQNQNRSPYSVWTNNSTTPPTNQEVDNLVSVQVTYSWSPGLLGLGPLTLTSTATVAMSY